MTRRSPYNKPDYVELYDRLGGEPALTRAIARFHVAVTSDERLKPFFDGVDWAKLLIAQTAFFTMAFGGPNAYEGLDMRRAHAPLLGRGLNDAHIDIVIAHFHDALAEQGVSPALIAEAEGYLQSMRDDILGR